MNTCSDIIPKINLNCSDMNTKEMIPEKTRSFGGKLVGFKDKTEQIFEKKHLKAYLEGRKFFTNGKDSITNELLKFKVKEIWI